MKPIGMIVAAVSCLLSPIYSDAGCRVACQQQVVQEQFVALATTIPVGVPVGQYGATTYSYDARPINVTVNLNTDAIAESVANKLLGAATPKTTNSAPTTGPTQAPIPRATTAPPSAVSLHCAKCHSAGGNATAFAKFNATNLAALTCQQRLAAARAVLLEKMPKGTKLTAEEAGDVLTELIGK